MDPNPTQIGAIFAIRVGMVALLITTPVDHVDMSSPKHIPARNAYNTPLSFIEVFENIMEYKNGHNRIADAIAIL
jgi:hypothetical protein